MDKSGDKFRQMEDEMSRFEAEISGRPMMGAMGAINQVHRNIADYNAFAMSGYGGVPLPPPPPMLVPHQINKSAKRAIAQASVQSTYNMYSTPVITQPAVVSAKPTLYRAPAKPSASQSSVQSSVDFVSLQSEVEKKLKKLKSEKVSAELAISQGKASSALQSFGPDDYRRRGKNKKLMRTAGGQTWEDLSLTDWPEDDFRIFCGDLGNDVTDELLTRTFNKYPSFIRARVVRDKRTNKSKGYGFISFKDPADFTKAMKEMNGRYVGSRPIKLRKSTWKNRCIDVARKKEKERAALVNMLTCGNGR